MEIFMLNKFYQEVVYPGMFETSILLYSENSQEN